MTKNPRLRVRVAAIVALMLVALAIVPAAASAMDVTASTTRPNGFAGQDTYGGKPTRLTWELRLKEGDPAVSALELVMPDGTEVRRGLPAARADRAEGRQPQGGLRGLRQGGRTQAGACRRPGRARPDAADGRRAGQGAREGGGRSRPGAPEPGGALPEGLGADREKGAGRRRQTVRKPARSGCPETGCLPGAGRSPFPGAAAAGSREGFAGRHCRQPRLGGAAPGARQAIRRHPAHGQGRVRAEEGDRA